jgi:predicted RNA-binding Zn ribbon-like protein
MEQPGDRPAAPGSLGLVQDFINTADLEGGSDVLRDPDQLRDFWRAHIDGMPDLTGISEQDVAICRDVRDALRAACRAHVGVALPAPLDGLLARGPLVLSISSSGDASVVPAPGLTGAPMVVAALTATVADAVRVGTWQRLKACDSDPCQWVYYDRSPAGRSRWCTMAICGSRAKMRAYRRRTA